MVSLLFGIAVVSVENYFQGKNKNIFQEISRNELFSILKQFINHYHGKTFSYYYIKKLAKCCINYIKR